MLLRRNREKLENHPKAIVQAITRNKVQKINKKMSDEIILFATLAPLWVIPILSELTYELTHTETYYRSPCAK